MSLLTPTNLDTARLELTGLDEYLKKIEAAGNSVEEAIRKALPESVKPIYKDIEAWAKKHKLTGATLKGLEVTDVIKEGNNFFIEVGISTKNAKYAWHAVFVEYGTPTQEPDPGIRLAFKNNKSKVKKIQREILSEEGIPTG